ncbi:hypothetical protein [Marinibactrum halimedae]|uniref:Porin n=1 Tax=Marinibactrum halimedae TaxID=1444977 RepID=A0AA37TAK8_9GAMM|nr:hypothetical protein [Marinibactrum halimedae]MCD9460072.1 hypothetical protein [Marinibactrum halimedae]GLS26470.1 hypothetical protein GCM10007877_21860 [Marinibactrum halimedae]
MKKRLLFILFSCFHFEIAAFELNGLIQANIAATDSLTNWQENGTGILRYDQDRAHLQHTFLDVTKELPSSFTLHTVLNAYQDGNQQLGFSQAELIYKPLSADTIKWQGRAGFFYPKLSLENVDTGWLSPYTYTQSAINSWIGEEQRTAGIEVTAYSPGRVRKSPWSWQIRFATFAGNDSLGALISWRGFAMHDRQSLYGDRVELAPYPSVINREGLWHPNWIEPFREIDDRLGVYVGAHLDYYTQTKFRYYYYDNLADPNALNQQRLYAWRTRYHSFAFQHRLSKQTRLISQYMTGSTEMGDNFVFVDYDAFYLMLSHRMNQHRVSLRYDRFIVHEDDTIPEDNNESNGYGITLAWRYNFTKQWQLGLEHHINRNTAVNRESLNIAQEQHQQQSLFVVQMKF